MKKAAFSFATIYLSVLSMLIFISCEDKSGSGQPGPEITSFTPSSGRIGTRVYIRGNHFFPSVTPGNTNLSATAITQINGTRTLNDIFNQDSISSQSIQTDVGPGTTSGKITVMVDGITGSTTTDFKITVPSYSPVNVDVTTFANSGGRGLAFDGAGNLYVADSNMKGIFKVTSDGVVSEFKSIDAFFSFGIEVGPDGNIYAAVDNTIAKITPDGIVTTLAGSATFGFADGKGSNAQFNIPWGIAIDPNGNVFVADANNNKIRKIAPDGTTTTVAGSTVGFQDGEGAVAKFTFPLGIAIDATGNLFVADGNCKIRKITTGGMVTTIAGSTPGYADGLAGAAQFNHPNGIVIAENGDLYIGDQYNAAIRKVTPDGMVTTLAGSTMGYSDGPGSAAQFRDPEGLVIDANGILYAADVGNFKIRKIVIH